MARGGGLVYLDGKPIITIGPQTFVKKASRNSPRQTVRVPIMRESPAQRAARHRAYTDPRPEVTPGKPKFIKDVNRAY